MAQTVGRHGGWCTWCDLVAAHPRRAVERAVSEASVLRVARNRYTLPTTLDATREAIRVGGTVSHLSAALLHGWLVKTVPDRTWVTLPRRRGSLRTEVGPVRLHHGDLTAADGPREPAVPDDARDQAGGPAVALDAGHAGEQRAGGGGQHGFGHDGDRIAASSAGSGGGDGVPRREPAGAGGPPLEPDGDQRGDGGGQREQRGAGGPAQRTPRRGRRAPRARGSSTLRRRCRSRWRCGPRGAP